VVKKVGVTPIWSPPPQLSPPPATTPSSTETFLFQVSGVGSSSTGCNQLHKNDDVLHEETGDIIDGIKHFLHMMFLPLDFFDEVSEVKKS
jgi:hypothetical protein